MQYLDELAFNELIALAWKELVSKQELLVYDHIAGHIKYMDRSFEQHDLHPDIIIKINLPEEKYALQKGQPDLGELIAIEAK